MLATVAHVPHVQNYVGDCIVNEKEGNITLSLCNVFYISNEWIIDLDINIRT